MRLRNSYKPSLILAVGEIDIIYIANEFYTFRVNMPLLIYFKN